MVNAMLGLIAGCTDADVIFTPEDPVAYDKYAATLEELSVPWTLGHVIVHVTASSEECAFLAAGAGPRRVRPARGARGTRCPGRR